jgi:hypothetical protein
MKITKITTEEDARQAAIDWQIWAADQSLSYGSLPNGPTTSDN